MFIRNLFTKQSEPANLVLSLAEYDGRDIAVVDIKDVVNFITAELAPNELRSVVGRIFDFLVNPQLCGRFDLIGKFQNAVDHWLDEN